MAGLPSTLRERHADSSLCTWVQWLSWVSGIPFLASHRMAVLTLSLAAYEVDESGRYWLWIQKRGKTKPTYVSGAR